MLIDCSSMHYFYKVKTQIMLVQDLSFEFGTVMC